jgi:hypothetical protein
MGMKWLGVDVSARGWHQTVGLFVMSESAPIFCVGASPLLWSSTKAVEPGPGLYWEARQGPYLESCLSVPSITHWVFCGADVLMIGT